jgi:hypothetical protein
MAPLACGVISFDLVIYVFKFEDVDKGCLSWVGLLFALSAVVELAFARYLRRNKRLECLAIGESAPPGRPALGIASLVLGILAYFMSAAFITLLIGALLGMVALALGIIHLALKRRPAGMAIWGVGTSVLALIHNVDCSKYYYSTPPKLADASQVLTPSVLWSKSIPGAEAMCIGDWDDDGTPRVLVAAGSTLHVLDLTGAETTSVVLPGRFVWIECGRNKNKGVRLLGYSNLGEEVTVVDRAGRKLWGVRSSDSIDGAHWGDLKGDGTDGLIVGFGGGRGLEAWSAEGQKMWSADLGNVWNQAIVPATQDKPARVFATEAGGTVREFNAQGRPLHTLPPDNEHSYYDRMTAWRAPDKRIQIAAISANKLTVFDEIGKVLWMSTAIATYGAWCANSFAVGDIKDDGTKELAFVDGTGSLILATLNGQRVSTIPHAKGLTAFAIASPPGKSGLLITMSNATVQAYAFQP